MTVSRSGMILLTVAAVLVPGSGGISSGSDEAASIALSHHRAEVHSSLESRLVQGLFDIQSGRLDEALGKVSDVISQRPDFALAQLVYGDVLLAMTDPLGAFGQSGPPDRVQEFREEARARLVHYLHAPPDRSLPSNLLRLPPSVDSILLVDLAAYRLFVFENRDGRPISAGDFYVSIGKGGSDKRAEGDEKTPVGVYVVSSYLAGSELPDLYGVGAFPISYPNPWDRLLGRTGSGIWIHGTESDRYSRPPLSSRGCVTLSNPDFMDLKRRVRIGTTPVIVSGSLSWQPVETVDSLQAEIGDAVERWRKDWESLDTDRYLWHYGESFRTEEMDRERFARHKRRVNGGKTFVRVGLEDMGIYGYPGEQDLILVEFLQRYDSDNYRSARRKQQYWRREGDSWKIVFEVGV